MTTKFDELVAKLTEIFQIDKPELDFGVYKVINAKAGMIRDFLNHDLKQKVQAALASKATAGKKALEDKIAKIEATLAPLGVAPSSSPEWVAAKAELDKFAANDDSESLVYAHLLTFFSRYYDDGDFISKRRYKEGQYVIPYSGEEVKLHWANADQYYTKSGENFTNYDFKLDNGRKVHFKLVAAATAKDNIKDNDCVRSFTLWDPHTENAETAEDADDGRARTPAAPLGEDDGRAGAPRPPLPDTSLEEKDGELYIYFQYKKFPKGTKKNEILAKTIAAVKDLLAKDATLLATYNLLAQVSKDDKRTVFEKQFARYTAKNTSDYFIHKDLRGFLTRELNSYVTNEMMNLDDISNAATFDAIAPNLRLIQTFRAIATELIGFMAQLEDFQKKLWLKKKFVVQCDWCVTISKLEEEIAALKERKDAADAPRIADIESLIAEAKANSEQQAEWDRLGFPAGEISHNGVSDRINKIDRIESEKPAAANAENAKDAKCRKGGVGPLRASANSAFFASAPAGNQNAVNPVQNIVDARMIDTKFFDERFKARLLRVLPDLDRQCDGILIHSDNFQALQFLGECYLDRINSIYIDPPYNTNDNGFAYKNNYRHSSWASMVSQSISKGYCLLRKEGVAQIAIDDLEQPLLSEISDALMGFENRLGNLVVEIKPSGRTNDYYFATSHEYLLFYAKQFDAAKINFFKLSDEQRGQYKESDDKGTFKWRDFLRTGGYSTPEERPNSYYPVYYSEKTGEMALERKAVSDIEIWPVDSEGKRRVWRKTKPSFLAHLQANELKVEKNKTGDYKVKIIDREKDGIRPKALWVGSQYDASSHGTKLLKKLFGEVADFAFPKSLFAVKDCLYCVVGENEEASVLDYFAGSGTTAHAVIALNREDGGHRKYILVEMGDHFDTVLKPRIEKVVYSPEWKDGKPVSSTRGISHCFKYLTLESYEDTLNNLKLETPKGAELGIGKNEYMMNYMLDIESRASLLSVDKLRHPFDYTLDIAIESSGATAPRKVDLVETFNYLVGLTVETEDRHIDKGYVLVTGTLPSGEDAIILWRDCDKVDNAKLREILKKQAINPRAQGFVLYVNGDHDLPNSVKGDDGEEKVIKVASIDASFLEKMFAEE